MNYNKLSSLNKKYFLFITIPIKPYFLSKLSVYMIDGF